jgi:geranylgeranyl diphosphate synthase type I
MNPAVRCNLTDTARSEIIQPSSSYEPYQKALEEELRQVFASREGFLYDLLRYHLRWVDQRGVPEDNPLPFHFQPMLALVSCEVLSGAYQSALPAAAAIELAHNFVEVHGEVQAGMSDSPDRPSIWWVWGPAQAINAGDGLHALARVTIMRLAGRGVSADRVLRAVQALDRACLTLCEGQYIDLSFQEQPLVASSMYYDMIGRKAGALAGCSAELGTLVAGAGDDVCNRFREMGIKLGMAWQITQDIADLWGYRGDGMTVSNVLNKKKGLPVIYTLENASVSTKRELGTIYLKRVLEPDDVSRIVAVLDRANARKYAEGKAKALVEQGFELLGHVGLPVEGLEALRRLAQLALASNASTPER